MKKYTLILLIAVFAVSMAFVAASCANMSMHNYSSKWSSDADNHFHRCTDSGCQARSGEAAHDWELIEGTVTRAPTCGVHGYGSFKCTICEATIDMPIPPTEEHDWEDVPGERLDATCGADGFQVQQCKNCKQTQVVIIPATGDHQFGEEYEDAAEIGTADKDGEDGGHYPVCSVCGARGELEGHVAGASRELSPADAKNMIDGKKVTPCEKCGHIMSEEISYAPGVPVYFEISMNRNGDKSVELVEKTGAGFQATITPSDSESGYYFFSFVNAKDRNGEAVDLTNFPSALTVKCTLRGGDEDKVLGVESNPYFADPQANIQSKRKGHCQLRFNKNFPKDGNNFILIELYTTDMNGDQILRASARLFLNIVA